MSFWDLIVSLLGQGLVITLLTTVLAAILALVLGFIAGLMRLSKNKLVRFLVSIYVEVFRGTSLLVQLFWIYFVLPMFGITMTALTAAVLAIGLNFGAYTSEVVRSGIQSVDKGQIEASIALNFTKVQRMKRIIIPQAFIIMLPNLGNQLIELFKSTSLVALITLTDLTYQANVLNATTLQTTQIFTALLVIYFVIAWPMTKGMKLLERKMTEGRM
ncbi:ectoine/hydroxyectoine ABC transporter permease subunit EhuC [Alkalibacterium olivapovliticus]|uniref:Polar amino acid transport system permease protein n=1 Tax=Alkalibacterium olivapovliticus TaxID=99907 RepID=A0A2T0VZR0_9LACT|nr:ectoine/hydroxyectoine ABC transporter permease subunit EhuC [Alkalibacterium olivapovliticus]PRY78020.1 polar amino acid transport system permease protein [Alkalibacterium olivapovliticus]